MQKFFIYGIIFFTFSFVVVHGAIVHVPGDVSTIQGAIQLAQPGDTVLVEPGTYKENINFLGHQITVASRYLLTRDLSYITNTIIDGSAPTNPNIASVVLFINHEDTTSILEGFTLTGGSGTVWQDHHNLSYYREGGGILTDFSSPIIKNNLIINNVAHNTSGVTSAGGGGIRCSDGNPRILNNVIMQNDGRYGGGIVLNYTGAVIKNNIIYKNTGGEEFAGSGVWSFANGPAQKILENNTIVENSSGLPGGGIYLESTAMTIRNNIIWGNTAPSSPQIFAGGSAIVTYCDVQGGWTGSSNINKDPFFTDTSMLVYPTSPCIDAGDPNSAYYDPADTANPGNALFPSLGTLRNDMGAYGGHTRAIMPTFSLHKYAPRPPSAIIAHSDYQTPASIRLTWIDPDSTNAGFHLDGFKIRIYRGQQFLADVDSGVQVYLDSNLTNHQQYEYYLRSITPTDSSRIDSASAFAGGSAYPALPSSFDERDSTTGIILHWNNPATQTDHTPLNDLAVIYIYRDSALLDSMVQSSADTGQYRSYFDSVKGYHYYWIRSADNETPVHFSTRSDSTMGFSGLDTVYSDDFETGIGDLYHTGTWDTTSAIADSGSFSLTDSPGGNYAPNATTIILTPSIVLGQDFQLYFNDIAIVRPGSYCAIDISTDHRRTFTVLKAYNWTGHPPWQDGIANPGDWYREHIDLSSYTGDTVTVRLRFVTGSGPGADGWYIDNFRFAVRPPIIPITLQLQVQNNWNMVSVPLSVNSHGIDSLFSGAISRAFAYNNGYGMIDSLVNGSGYWIKFPGTSAKSITGFAYYNDTIDIVKGWNMIGSISDSVDTATIVAIPHGIISQGYFGYTGTGYFRTHAIQPGFSYWVKASQPGKLILSAPQNKAGYLRNRIGVTKN